MSIYGTWLALGDDEHEDGCAIYEEVSPGLFEFSGKPCDCGIPRAPIIYEGSHVLPSPGARRGGDIDVAAIPAFIERDGQPAGPHDWLRLTVCNEASQTMHEGAPYVAAGSAVVLLDRPLVEELRNTLTAWLERDE